MRFDTHQAMKLGQQMKLAPRVIQSMEILQMPMAELEERIEQEIENNITLDVAEPGSESGAADTVDGPQADADVDPAELDRAELQTGSDDDFARLDQYEADHPDAAENEYSAARMDRPEPIERYEPVHRARQGDPDRDAKMEAMAAAPARSASLEEQLQDQWRLSEVDGDLRALGVFIIASLDPDGFLRQSLETLVDKLPADLRSNGRTASTATALADLERALYAVQLTLEPVGIAARDARECLLLQLDQLEDDGVFDEDDQNAVRVARAIAERHLDDLMQNRLPKIAEAEKLTIDEIKGGLELLRRLSLAPARRLINDAPAPILPDAVVEYEDDEDRYIAYLNENRLPALQINRRYSQMAKDRAVPKKDRDFIKTNLSNAQWLLDAITQRNRTLLRVLNVVVDAQRDYFDLGPQALKPLAMTAVAEQLGIHVATVSRAVADKHVLTPRGVAPMRSFFTGGSQTDDGEDVSWDSIKAALQDVIEHEDKAKPFSDDALVKQLKERGIDIARRTIAKYRAQLGIPSARLRKTY
ncbi:MAG: RNA polymerase factor sigma-54 [Planctomycetota bacterium]